MARKRKSNIITKCSIPSIQKAFSILELLSSQKRGHTISEFSRIFKIPVSSASSLLYSLVFCGYLKRDEKGVFSLTAKLLVEGNKLLDNMELREIARPEMEKLSKTTGLASMLSIRDGNQLVCIEKVEGTSQIRVGSNVGKRFYLHSTATGKALLAQLSEQEVQQIVESAGMPQLSQSTITSVPLLLKELARVRSQGYAIDNSENTFGIRGIAAPVFDHQSEAVAALGVGGVGFELEQNMKEVIAVVKGAAMEVSERLGYSESVVSTPLSGVSSALGMPSK